MFLRVDDGGYHERDKSYLGGCAYTGNCFVFSLSHFHGVEYDTDIFTERLRCTHAYAILAQTYIRAEPHSLPSR